MAVLQWKLATVLILSAISKVKADDDDTEFILNIFSDFGPILALFGDQFARQFASESLTLLDHVIFACVPLGIVTALIGAIRVQGPKFAKAFIGRARENRSTIELELMSSTSDDVCEMFSGRGVVRTLGRPRLKQILIFPDIYNTFQEHLQKAITTSPSNDRNHDEQRYTDVDASCGIHTLDTAYGLESSDGYSGRIMELEVYHGRTFDTINTLLISLRDKFNIGSRGLASAGHDDTPKSNPITKPTAKSSLLAFLGPPNLHLNVSPTKVASKANIYELYLSFLCAVILQIGLFTVAAVSVYHKNTRRSTGYDTKPWGLPCYMGGSLLLFLGLFVCSMVVEVSTTELKWTRVNREPGHHTGKTLIDPDKPRVLWAQPQQRINDQAFDSLVCLGGARNHLLTSSRQNAWEIHAPRIKDYATRAVEKGAPGEHQSAKANNAHAAWPPAVDDSAWVRCAWETVTALGVLAGVVGFTTQFIGLRALPWPCAVSQLGAILCMAGVRAFLRRRLGRLPPYCNALPGYELDFLAHQIVMNDAFRNFYHPDSQSKDFEENEAYNVCEWEVETPGFGNNDTRSKKSTHPTPSEDSHQHDNDEAPSRAPYQSQHCVYPTMELIFVRKRLGDLCKWTSNASTPALALSQAIEFFLELFPPRSLKLISWPISGNAGYEWRTTGRAEIFMTRKETNATGKRNADKKTSDSEWTVEIGKLEAVLSLWLATMESKMIRNVKENVQASHDQSDWRKRKMTIDQKVSCRRLLGSRQDGVLSRDIAWWANSFLVHQENDTIAPTSNADDSRPLVIGFSGDSPEDTKLSVSSTGSLPILAAQHLFTGFMWMIVQFLPANCLDQGAVNNNFNVGVQVPNTLDSHSFPKAWERIQFTHEKLKKFTHHAEKMGLGTTTEILLCMIPAFSAHGLLPNEAILEQLPQIGQDQGVGWVEVAKCYKSLLETQIRKEPPERFTFAIVIRTMEFIELASEPLDANPDAHELGELRQEIRSIVGLLSNGFRNVLFTLAPIYKLQNRHDLFQHIFSFYGFNRDIFNHYVFSRGKFTGDRQQLEYLDKFIGFGEAHYRAWYSAYAATSSWRSYLWFIDEDVTGKSEKQPYDEAQVGPPRRRHVKVMAATDMFRRSPLHYAITTSNAEIVEDLLEATRPEEHMEYHEADICERAPIHLAAASGDLKILGMIIKDLEADGVESQRGALRARCLNGMTPLHLAVKGKHLGCVRELLNYYVPKDVVDIWKRGPIHTAVINRSLHIVKELIHQDIRPDLMDRFGKTALAYLGEVKDEDMTVLKELVQPWEDFNTKDSTGKTIMHHAVQLFDLAQISDCINRGAAVNKADLTGKTPLHLAMEGKKKHAVNLLLAHNALASIKDIKGVTPLMLACGHAWGSVVHRMVKQMKGLDMSIGDKDSKGQTVLHYVCGFKGTECQWPDEGCVGPIVATLLDNIEQDKQKDFACPDLDGVTPLILAVINNRKSVVVQLLAKDVDIDHRDCEGYEALHYAMQNGHVAIFQTLLQRKKKENRARNNSLSTDFRSEALHMACEVGAEIFVDLLTESPMDPNWKSVEFQRTPFHEALYKLQPGIVKKLLQKDTIALRWDLADDMKLTPVEVAMDFSNDDCILAMMQNTNARYTSETGQCFALIAGVCYRHHTLLTRIAEDGAGIATSHLEILVSRLPRSDFHQGIFRMWEGRVLQPETLAQMKCPAHVLARCQDSSRERWEALIESVKKSARKLDEDNWTAIDVANRYDSPIAGRLLDEGEDERPSDIEYRWPSLFEPSYNIKSRLRCGCGGLEYGQPECEGVQEIWNFFKRESGGERRMIYTRECIPPNVTKFYFEVQLVRYRADTSHVSDVPFIGVGFSQLRGYPIDEWPGMVPCSWAYHGDDGSIRATGVDEDYASSELHCTDQALGFGDVVGCGMDLETGESYCTYNGERLDSGTIVQERRLHTGKVYPLICHPVHRPFKIRVVLKRSDKHPFRYSEANNW